MIVFQARNSSESDLLSGAATIGYADKTKMNIIFRNTNMIAIKRAVINHIDIGNQIIKVITDDAITSMVVNPRGYRDDSLITEVAYDVNAISQENMK